MQRRGKKALLRLAIVNLIFVGGGLAQFTAVSAGERTASLAGIHPYKVLIEPGANIRLLTRAIDRAQVSIFIETYILTDTRIVHALERAEAQGVGVYVLLERHPLGMGLQPERMADQLRAAGIAVRWTSPSFFLTHAKFMILDDRLAVVSTANFSRSAFTRNREVIVFDHDRQDVHEISNLFRSDWDRIPDSPRDSHLLVSPGDSRPRLFALIAVARKSLDVYAEEVADPAAEALMIRKARAHIRVRLIVPWGANPADVRRLVRGGVAVRELTTPYIHAKVMVVDGRLAFVGSENLSATSLDRNRELGLLLAGSSIHRILQVFSADWRRGVSLQSGAAISTFALARTLPLPSGRATYLYEQVH